MSDEYKRQLAQIFDARSINYDEDNLRARLANRLVEIVRPQPGERVLDIATGTGLVAIPTAQRLGECGRVVGVDLSKGMLDRASRDIEAEGLGNIELIHTDGEKLVFPPSSFDLILCSSALPYMSDIPAALWLWHGLLKPGGRLAFNCWSDASYNMGPLLRSVADRHGIELPRTVEEVGTPYRCRAVLSGAGFPRAEVVVEPLGEFITMEEAEKAWDRWMKNPIFHPHRNDEAIKLAGLRGEYIEEARRRLTSQGIWDEATAYYVTAWRA
jgi:ubiquinone/menaquinone biosynthesis C-methylase UbiE